jgi:putative membrane protein
MRTMIVTLVALAGLALPAAAAADPPAQDQNWLMTSISGDRFEIAGGKIALSRAETPMAKAFATRLIRDHSKSLKEAVDAASRWGMKAPPAATPSEQWELNRLKNMPRGWFDVQYAALEIKDHNQDIEETGFEAREGEAADLRALARQDLPMLNLHLKLAKEVLTAAEAAKHS